MTETATTQNHNSPVATAPVPMSANEPHEDYEASLDQRANELAESLNAEQREHDRADDGEDPSDSLDESTREILQAVKQPSKVEQPKTDAEKDRQARLDRVAKMERESVKISSQNAQKERELSTKDQALARREKDLAQLEGVFNDPEALLGFLADKVGAEKLSNWLVEQANPERKLEAKAKGIEAQVEDRLRRMEESMAARERAIQEREQAQTRSQQRATSESTFASRVGEMASEAPYLARLVARRPSEAMKMGHAVTNQLVELAKGKPVTFDEIIHEVESQLSDYAEIYSPQNSGLEQNTRPEHRSPSAAAKAPSNRTASERTSIANEDEDYSRLSIDERARRLERTLKRQ